jgi:uncharacterized protein involved in exopolysaccharide biosynthesis
MQDEPIRDSDEIDLLDLIFRIWRRKYIVIGGTAIITLAVLAISMAKPKTYSVSMVLQPGIIELKPDGKTIYTDSISSLKNLIGSGAFNQKIIDEIGLPDGQKGFAGINFQVPKEDNRVRYLRPELQPKTLRISSMTTDPEHGVKALNALGQKLLQHYQSIINQYQQNFDMQIKAKLKDIEKTTNKIAAIKIEISSLTTQNRFNIKKTLNSVTALEAENIALEADNKAKLAAVRNQIASTKAQQEAAKKIIANIKQRISGINKEIERISMDSDRLFEERKKILATSGSENQALSAVIYSNTIQQNISYLNSLQNRVNEGTTRIYNENLKLEQMTNSIMELEAQFTNIEEQSKFKRAKINVQIVELKDKKENLKKELANEIKALETKIKDLQADESFLSDQIESLNYKKGNLQNIKILRPAKAPLSHIKPGIKRNVAVAIIGGGFLMLIIVLLMEAVAGAKKRRDLNQADD